MPRTRAQVLKESRALSCPYYKKKTSTHPSLYSDAYRSRLREMPCVEGENPPGRTRAERRRAAQREQEHPHPQFLVETTWLPPGVRVTKKGGKVVVEKVMTGDCMMLALEYVQNQSRMLGSAAFAISCLLVRYKIFIK